LSLFIARDKAVAWYNEYQNYNRQIHQQIGTHLAQGAITAEDGIATPPDRHGHFGFFEAANSNIGANFSIIEAVFQNA